jgi:hypothetical protein
MHLMVQLMVQLVVQLVLSVLHSAEQPAAKREELAESPRLAPWTFADTNASLPVRPQKMAH